METLTEYRDRSKEIDGWLREAGIKTKPYINPPLDKDVFALTMDGNNLRFWPGLATIEVDTDKQKRQAVMVVNEGRREITRTWQMNTAGQSRPVAPTREMVFREFPVYVPRRRFGKYSVRDLTPSDVQRAREQEYKEYVQASDSYTTYSTRQRPRPPYFTTQWEITATIIVPESETTFLVGFDERRQFISMLPKRANSVEQAHRILRPAGVPDDAIRQGEWFFVPVSPTVSKKLDDYVQRHPTQLWMAPLENYSSHHAVRIRMNGDTYANMVAFDTRKDHHGPIKLDGWHRVVRNTEVVPRNSQARVAQRMWD
jgi:hypothetical protein